MIMKIKTIGNLQYLTNVLLILNVGTERFVGNIVLKHSSQMALMSMKNLVCNMLARQKIFCFINVTSILVVLTYCYYFYYFYIVLTELFVLVDLIPIFNHKVSHNKWRNVYGFISHVPKNLFLPIVVHSFSPIQFLELFLSPSSSPTFF